MCASRPFIFLIAVLFSFFCQSTLGQTNNEQAFYLYEDSAKKLTGEAANELFKKGGFVKAAGNELNVGFTRSVFWLAYQNDHDIPGDSLLLYIGHHHINRIHFYFIKDSILKQQWLTGDYFPFAQRPVNATGFYFPINKKGFYLARIDKSNESLQLSFELVSHIQALSAESDNKSVMALLTGIVLLMIIFGTYLFAISGEKVYLYYILYIATGWLWVLANAGYGFQYIWPNLPWFASKARPFFALSPLIFATLFLVHFIGAIKNKKVYRAVVLMNFILLACLITILLFKEEGYQSKWWFYIQYLIPFISLFYIILTLFVLIKASIRGNKLAMFYLAAILVLIITVIFQVSFSLGSIRGFGNIFTHFGLSVGFILEAMILTAGLAYRFNQYRVDKETLLIEMNKRQQENTRILLEVQEAERSQVANQLHDVAGSLLSAARLNLSSFREKELLLNKETSFHLQKTEEALDMVSDMVRDLSHALSPVMLEKVGFKTSLEKIISIVNASGKINIRLLITGFEKYEAGLNSYYIAFYSIIYELLNNMVKHSGAKNALLQVTEYEDCFTLLAEDDGKGVEQGQLNKKDSIGVAGIRSKINYFGGIVAFDKNEPTGLIVTIEIPIIRDAK